MVQIGQVARSEASGESADVRRREILIAASRLFRQRGFADTGMRDIAAELDMTAGNLYYYFENKQALLAYCQETTLDELAGGRSARSATPDAPAKDRLRDAIVAHVVALNESHPGSIAHLEIEALEPERRAPLLRKRKDYERRLERLIRDGIDDRSFQPVDARLATLALLGALNWTVKWFRAGGGKSASEVGADFADLFLYGLQGLGSGGSSGSSGSGGSAKERR